MSNLFYKTAPAELRAAATLLTGSRVASASLDVSTQSYVTIETLYALGVADVGATGVEVYPEVSMDGTTWAPAVAVLSPGTPGSGEVASEVLASVYTQADAGRRTWHVPVYGAVSFRVSVRQLGSPSPFGTCGIRAVASRLGT